MKKSRHYHIAFALAWIVAASWLCAETSAQTRVSAPFRLGVWGGYGVNNHTANFPELQGFPVFFPRSAERPGPPNFSGGAGAGLSLGVAYQTPLARSLALSAQISFAQLDATLLTSERTALGDRAGNVVEARHEYALSVSPASLGASVGAVWNPFGGFNISAALQAAYIVSGRFQQEERLVGDENNPSGEGIIGGFNPQTFPRARNRQEDFIPNLQPLQLFADFTLGYEIPLGFTRLAPEIGYSVGITNLIGGGGGEIWRVSRLHAGVKAMFTLQALSGGVVQLSDESFDQILDRAAAPSDDADYLSSDGSIARGSSEKISQAKLSEQKSSEQKSLEQKSSEQKSSEQKSSERVAEEAGSQETVADNEAKTTENLAPALETTATALAAEPSVRLSADIAAFGSVRVMRRSETTATTETVDEEVEERRKPALLAVRQEIVAREYYSLLPYVFFDGERSADIPARYARLSASEVEAFQPDKLRASTKLTPKQHPYYHLLNVVGYRMRRYPEAKLNILGGIDAASRERDNLRLARARALAVADYLQTVWGIDSTRLILGVARLTAKSPRMFNEQDRQAENRRVELSSDTTALLEPLLLADTLQRAIPSRLTLAPIARLPRNSAVAEWRLTLAQRGRTLKEWQGDALPPKEIEWRLSEKDIEAINPRFPLELSLRIEDDKGEVAVSPTRALPVESPLFRAADPEYADNRLIEKFNVILFNATKSSVAQTQSQTLKSITTRISSRSKVLLEGYMDKSDDEETNRKLSRARAQAVGQALKLLSRGAQADARGYGSEKPLYDERLPEGRMYARTVLITVETPLGASAAMQSTPERK